MVLRACCVTWHQRCTTVAAQRDGGRLGDCRSRAGGPSNVVWLFVVSVPEWCSISVAQVLVRGGRSVGGVAWCGRACCGGTQSLAKHCSSTVVAVRS